MRTAPPVQEIRVNRSHTSSSSTSLLGTLLERYERTFRERQRAIAVVNDELLDIDELVKRYRTKIDNSSRLTSEGSQVRFSATIVVVVLDELIFVLRPWMRIRTACWSPQPDRKRINPARRRPRRSVA